MRTPIPNFVLTLVATATLAAPSSAQDMRGHLLLEVGSPVLQALCRNDRGPLLALPVGGLVYLQAVVTPLHDQSLSWRVPPEIRLIELDPFLPYVLNTRMLTSPEFHNDIIEFGLGAGLNVLSGFAKARERNVATGAIDPGSETAALMQGLLAAGGGFGRSVASAERDADVMIALLGTEETIGTFRACYDGLRAAVMEGQ